MTTQSKKLAMTAAITAAIAATPMSALATNGILQHGNGIVSMGAGGAGVANPGEGMSAADNPALAALVGPGWSIQATAFNPNRSANMGRGYVESDSSWFLIPGGHWFTDVGDNSVAGLTVTPMGGLGTDYPPALFGTQTGIELSGLLIEPTAATKVTDNITLGFGLIFGYQMMESEGAGPQGPNGPFFPTTTDDSAWGWGFEIGAAIQAGPSTMIGLDYQSEIWMEDMDEFGNYLFAQASDPALNLPAIVTVGITQGIGENWKLSFDISDVPWSSVAVFDEVFGWEDQTVYKLGAEVQLNDTLAMRFGYNRGETPIPDSAVMQNVLAPAVTEDHFTIGFTKKFDAGNLHGFYAYMPEAEQTQNPVPPGFPAAQIKMDQNAFGLSWEVNL